MPTGVQIKRMSKGVGGLDGLKARLESMKKLEVAMGFPAGMAGAYPDGTPVVEVAAAHVFGVGVPERDFMALAKPKIISQGVEMLKEAVKLNAKEDAMAIKAVLEAVGQMGISEIRAAIVDGAWEPNSNRPMSAALREKVAASWGVFIPPGMSYLEAKMEFRGSDKPLIDTGRMVQAVTAVVRDKSS